MAPQSIILEADKFHNLILVIHLNKKANVKNCLRSLDSLNAHINKISPIKTRNPSTIIKIGIGFGSEFLQNIKKNYNAFKFENFTYEPRLNGQISMPNTGGDILLHAICDEQGKLFELTRALISELPEQDINKVEEEYCFRYRDLRDLSDFVDGTENPNTVEDRLEVAVNKTTGGSFAIVQKWVHNLKKIKKTEDSKMEKYIGRTKLDSVELSPLPPSSHVARMTAGLTDEEADEKRIVRHSMSYGKVTGDCGLYFIAYSSTVKTLNWMLDRMTGKTSHDLTDSIFKFTTPITGAYFYMPGKEELSSILKSSK